MVFAPMTDADRKQQLYLSLKWPAALAKSVVAPGEYILGLDDGSTIYFGSATPHVDCAGPEGYVCDCYCQGREYGLEVRK